jgi:signal transduction histidine kinase
LIYYTKEDTEIPFLVVKNSQIIGVNDAFLKLSGYSLTEILNKSFSDLWHHMLRIHVAFKAVIEEAFMFTKALEAKCISVHSQERGAPNETVYWFAQLPDSEFKYKNPFLSKLISENMVGVGIYGAPNFILLNANQRYLDCLPKPYHTKDLAYGKTLKEIVPQFMGSEEEQHWMSVIEKSSSFYIKEQYAPLSKDGGIYWNNILTPIEQNGQIKYIVSILEDITDRILNRMRMSEQADTIRRQKGELDTLMDHISQGMALFEYKGNPVLDAQGSLDPHITDPYEKGKPVKVQKEQLEFIFNNMSDAIFIVDKNKNIILKNIQAQQKVFPDSLSSDLTYDHLYSECFDMDGNELSLDMLPSMKALKGEPVVNFQIKIKNCKIEWLADVIADPIYDEEGSIAMAIVCLRDITHHVKLEAARSEKTLEEAMVMKDEFLYLITHDFKTPIAVINSALQAIDLICKGEISDKLGKFLDTIRQNTNRQLRLVNNLLDITRITSGHAKHHEKNVDIVYITQAIVNSVDIYVQQKNIKLSFFTEIPNKIIRLDEEKYERILLNLLSNALKFTPNGKSIYVELSMKKHKNRNMICLQVRDEGIGIEKDKQDYIFERFGQVESSLSRQAEGTGLGLHLVKLLVSSIKGTLTLESEPEKGSSFIILIPATKEKILDRHPKQTDPEDSFMNSDSRIIAATAIEFSDIYF